MSAGMLVRAKGRAPVRRGLFALAAVAAAALAGLVPGAPAPVPVPAADAQGVPLEESEVTELIARCVFYARRIPSQPQLTIGVVDTEGNALAVFHMAGVPQGLDVVDPDSRERRAARALAKAGTGAYFSSDQQSFTTRTAEFIIEDHYPPGVRFQGAGPLYGVEFSSAGVSDVNPITFPQPAGPEILETRVRGDLGGLGLFKAGRRVGGLGIDDGDPRKQVTIPDRVLLGGECDVRYRLTFANLERGRAMERIVVAAARRYLPPPKIRATRIAVGGIRLPYARPPRLPETAATTLGESDGDFDPSYPLRSAADIPSRFRDFTLDPPASAGPDAKSYRGQIPEKYPIIAGTDGLLSESDVRRILWQGAARASITRGAIRRPIGLGMQCWISVVDTNGVVLGVFRFREDATMFSYDVAVQKARTTVLFSDSEVAWTCRALGLFSQAFYPAGQQGRYEGPLFQLQDGLTVGLITGAIAQDALPTRNGITVFPGGVPLYRNGQLVGGVGVSGDGVDQDDIVSYSGSSGYGAPAAIRCDAVNGAKLKASLRRAIERISAVTPQDQGICDLGAGLDVVGSTFLNAALRRCRVRLDAVPFVVGPSYVKFPRHPGPVTRR